MYIAHCYSITCHYEFPEHYIAQLLYEPDIVVLWTSVSEGENDTN